MLEWHDGDGWEHRAFWGLDTIREGKLDTPGRHRAGELPETNKWVRLEVPAAKVGLEGKTLRGMAFKVNGGQVLWGRTGTVQVEEPSVKVVKSFAMKQVGEDSWLGSFPLVGEGMFRAELRSPSGHANKPMKEMRYIALPDKPPYVALERKNNETALSKPAEVPLSIAAFDDYGLDEILVLFRDSPTGAYRSRSLWQAGKKPLRNLALEAQLTESAALTVGGSLRYLIEARDTKGQTARTQEFLVRIAADHNSEDNKLDAFDKTQDTFTDKLVKLMSDQKKVKAGIEKLEKEYAALTEKLNKVKDEVKPADKTKPDDKTAKPEEPLSSKLTREEQKRLAELQKELAKLAGDEERNAETARQVNEELKKSIEEAGKLDLLPQAVLGQMASTQKLFDKMVAQALKNLGKDLKDGADTKSGKPDLPDLKNKSDRVDKELSSIKDRLDALSKARKDLRDDLRKAIAELRDKMAREDSKLSARELEELKKFLDNLREQLKEMKARQGDLKNETEKSDDVQGKKEQAGRPREATGEPAGQGEEVARKEGPRPSRVPRRAVPRRRQGSESPAARRGRRRSTAQEESQGKGQGRRQKGRQGQEGHGRRRGRVEIHAAPGRSAQKLDPRFAKKRRPVMPKGKNDKSEKEDLEDRQNDKGRDLDAAEKSVKSDQNSLNDLLDQLRQATEGKGKKGKNNPDNSSPERGAGAGRSTARDDAVEIDAGSAGDGRRREDGRQGPGKRQTAGEPLPNTSDEGNLQGGDNPSVSDQGNLSKLDPATRAMILKMPPSRYREELIRGLAEQGPEAYRGFIQDYFKRLTESKKK